MNPCLLRLVAGSVLPFSLLARSTQAQCATQLVPGPSGGGDATASTLWDPDGAGPQPPQMVLVGSFAIAGASRLDNIATFDPASGVWQLLGGAASPTFQAVATLTTGELVAASGQSIWRWNGTSWVTHATDLGGWVDTIVPLPGGEMAAGGWFTTAGAVPANYIARWNGAAWSSFGSGMNDRVFALQVMPNGDLVAGGIFTSAGGLPANRVARWNGATWGSLGAGMNDKVSCLTTAANGDLVAGGYFSSAGGSPVGRLARWDGTNWTGLGSGVGGQVPPVVHTVARLANGDLVAGGDFQLAGNLPAHDIAVWNGMSWSSLATAPGGVVRGVAPMPDGTLLAFGDFAIASGTASGIVRWDGASWTNLLPGIGLRVHSLHGLRNGGLLAGGIFSVAGGIAANCISRWDGSAWNALGAGLSGGNQPTVLSMTELPNGDIIAGGTFTLAGGVAANHIARWNGSAWSALGGGMTLSPQVPEVRAIISLPNGDIIAGGRFYAGNVSAYCVARWNGAWTRIDPSSAPSGAVNALLSLGNGEFVAGGQFTTIGSASCNRVARWNGSAWVALGTGLGGTVHALALLPNGDLVVAGEFTSPGSRIARWNGATWSALGSGLNGTARTLVALPNGDLLVGGDFTMAGGVSANRLARWNGAQWAAVGQGTSGTVRALGMLAHGEVACGGDFGMADGVVSAYFARLTTTCPATATPIPTACIGPSGPVALTANTLPWTGGTFRSRAIGFGANSVAASLVGFGSPATPLSFVTPLGIPGCDLLASPDSALILVPTAGSASWLFDIPNSPAWAGMSLFHQFLQLELAPTMTLSSSNALALTLGTL